MTLNYKGIPAKCTEPLPAYSSETRLGKAQTVRLTHTKPAADGENNLRIAKLQLVFISDSGTRHLLASVGSVLSNSIVGPTRCQRMRNNLGWLAGRLGDVPFIR